MKNHLLFALLGVSALLAGAQKPQLILLSGPESNQSSVLPDLEIENLRLQSRGIQQFVKHLAPGEPTEARVEGTGTATLITLVVNGVVVHEISNVELPYTVPFKVVPMETDQVDLNVVTAFGLSTLSAAAAPRNVDAMPTVRIRFFIPFDGGLAEVITGAPTAGGFVRRSRFCAIASTALSRCPKNRIVLAVTDRATRGDSILTRFDRGSGPAFAFIEINGTNEVGPIPLQLPTRELGLQRVSPNANDDNIVIKILNRGRTNTRRVPIGSRP